MKPDSSIFSKVDKKGTGETKSTGHKNKKHKSFREIEGNDFTSTIPNEVSFWDSISYGTQ